MPWYVAHTKRGEERRAAGILEQRQVQAYLPILRKRKPRAGRRNWEPLFPGYLFANLTVPSEQWLAARSAPGIAYFLGNEGHPTSLPEDFMLGLMARVELANCENPLHRFTAGERVIITDGPFRSMEAIFDRTLSPSGRSRVLMQLLHRLVAIEVPEEYLDRVLR
ncbi:MAG: hypothetical protein HY332_07880 [Chloroflexi bacterium]|nr:hypothetical protein [Chloroflexota bacterium]